MSTTDGITVSVSIVAAAPDYEQLVAEAHLVLARLRVARRMDVVADVRKAEKRLNSAGRPGPNRSGSRLSQDEIRGSENSVPESP